MDPLKRYAAVLGRNPFIEVQSANLANVHAYGFPALKRSFWRNLMSEFHDKFVYVTAGMSEHSMHIPPDQQKIFPSRIELMAVPDGQITGGENGKEDIVAAWLLAISEYVINSNIFIGAGHTLDFQQPLSANTEMSAFLFTPLAGGDEKRLCKCTKAQDILNVVPVTAAELALIRKDGIGAIINLFEANGVRPVFDYLRQGVA